MTERSAASQVQRPNDPGGLRFVGESRPIPLGVAQYVSLPELEAPVTFSTFNCILLAQVIRHVKTGSGAKDKSIYSRVSQSTKDSNNFDRTMTLMCLNSPPGSNTMIVTLDGRKSDEAFGQCLAARDRQGGFGPGAIVAIRGPGMICNYFGDKNGLPILHFSGGMKLVDPVKSKIGMCNIKCSPSFTRMHGFYYTKAKLTLTQINVCATNCCGNLCDSIDMKSPDGSWKSSCACFIVTKALGSVVFDLNFTVKTEEEDEPFQVVRFTSRSFTNLVTKNGIPSSINVAQLEKAGADWEMFGELVTLVEAINNAGGFDLLGWLRIGRKNDASAPKDGISTTIQSSDMIRHVTRLRPHKHDVVSKTNTIDVEGILAKLYMKSSQAEQVPAAGGPTHVQTNPVEDGSDSSKGQSDGVGRSGTSPSACTEEEDSASKEQTHAAAKMQSQSTPPRASTNSKPAAKVTPPREEVPGNHV